MKLQTSMPARLSARIGWWRTGLTTCSYPAAGGPGRGRAPTAQPQGQPGVAEAPQEVGAPGGRPSRPRKPAKNRHSTTHPEDVLKAAEVTASVHIYFLGNLQIWFEEGTNRSNLSTHLLYIDSFGFS